MKRNNIITGFIGIILGFSAGSFLTQAVFNKSIVLGVFGILAIGACVLNFSRYIEPTSKSKQEEEAEPVAEKTTEAEPQKEPATKENKSEA